MTDHDYAGRADEALLALVRADDGKALDALLERYKNLVRIKARPYFIAGADRDDILQEGMIGLYKAIRDYQPAKQASFRMFAELCIARQIITAVKAAARKKHTPLNSYVSFYGQDGGGYSLESTLSLRGTANPEEMLIGNEDSDAIRNSIERELSKLEKDVLRAYAAGKSYRQIATETGRSEKSVNNAMQRIRHKLEDLLE